jgi:hypothetical protein
MNEYRLYCLNGDGGFTKAHDISAATDNDALERAQDMNLAVKCELWQRGRLVATIQPNRRG